MCRTQSSELDLGYIYIFFFHFVLLCFPSEAFQDLIYYSQFALEQIQNIYGFVFFWLPVTNMPILENK